MNSKACFPLERIWTSPERVFPPFTTAKSMWWRAHSMSSQYNPDDDLEEIWRSEISRGTVSIWRGGAANDAINPKTGRANQPCLQASQGNSASLAVNEVVASAHTEAPNATVLQSSKTKNAFGSLTYSWRHQRDYTGSSQITDVNEKVLSRKGLLLNASPTALSAR
jgi:hypothetical protein